MNIRLTHAAAGLLFLASGGVADAQTVVIAPEQETLIREYIVKEKVQPVEVPADVQITVGSVLPEVVELRPLNVPDVQYRYVVVGNQTVLVEPDTRKIVHIME